MEGALMEEVRADNMDTRVLALVLVLALAFSFRELLTSQILNFEPYRPRKELHQVGAYLL